VRDMGASGQHLLMKKRLPFLWATLTFQCEPRL
jgi:hypothetical protein